MPELWFDGQKAKNVNFDGMRAKEVWFDGRLVHQDEFVLDITGHNHNVDADWVWRHLHAMGGGGAMVIKIVVHGGVQLISQSTAVRGVFDFYGGWGGRRVTIENHGYILGRGGNGGSEGQSGGAGGTAIYTDGTTNVSVINYGVIAGGGGGGGGTRLGDSGGGGGGCPFGAGGWGSYHGTAQSGGFDYAGQGGGAGGTRYGGNGGLWGSDGSPGIDFGSLSTYGGAMGYYSIGNIDWQVLGDVRGKRA